MDNFEYDQFCKRQYKEARRQQRQSHNLHAKSFLITFAIGMAILFGVVL